MKKILSNKTKHYSKDFLIKVTGEIRNELHQCRCNVHTLNILITKEKKLLPNTGEKHDKLWYYRWKLANEEHRILELKEQSRFFYKIMNECYNEHNMKHLG